MVTVVVVVAAAEGVVEDVVEVLAVVEVSRTQPTRVAGALLLPGPTPLLVVIGMNFPSLSLC